MLVEWLQQSGPVEPAVRVELLQRSGPVEPAVLVELLQRSGPVEPAVLVELLQRSGPAVQDQQQTKVPALAQGPVEVLAEV